MWTRALDSVTFDLMPGRSTKLNAWGWHGSLRNMFSPRLYQARPCLSKFFLLKFSFSFFQRLWFT